MKANILIVTSVHQSPKGNISVGGYLEPIQYNTEKGTGFFCPMAKLCIEDEYKRDFEFGDEIKVKELGKDRFNNVLCLIAE